MGIIVVGDGQKKQPASQPLVIGRDRSAEFGLHDLMQPGQDALAVLRWLRQGIQNLPNDTPLTDKLYEAGPGISLLGPGGQLGQLPKPVANVMARLAPAAAGFIGWRAGGPAGAAMVNAGVGRGTAALLGMAAEGAIGGAAGGAAQAVVEQEPVAPNAVAGAGVGATFGAVIGKLAGATNALEREFARRAGPPLSLTEIAERTPNLAAKRLAEMRQKAAGLAFREMVPEGGSLEGVGNVLWERAKASARRAAGKAIQFEDDPTWMARAVNDFLGRGERVSNPKMLNQALDAGKKFWGQWVTRAGITLRRDGLSFPDGVGAEAANAMDRIADLRDAYEGPLVQRMNQMLDGLSNREITDDIFNAITHADSPRPLSAAGTATVQVWRNMSDEMFQTLEQRGVKELVPPAHPAGQTEMFPEVAEQAKVLQALDPEKEGWKLVPLQYRQNYAPFYRDPKAVNAIRSAGPARAKVIDDMLESGQAGSREEAEALLDQMLDENMKGIPLHIRGGVAQHSREIMARLPVMKDARIWMRRAIHEHAKRAAEAEVLGGQDDLFVNWMQRLKANGGDTRRFEGFFRLAVNRPWPEQVKYASAVRGIGTAMNVAYLGPRVAVLQFMQLSNPAARLGWRAVGEGIVGAIKNPGLREMAEEAGVTLPSFHLQTGEIDAMSKFGRQWMEWVTNMPRFDRAMRIVSGISGGMEAQRLAKRMVGAAGGRAATLARRLEYLGLDPEQVVQQGGQLSRDNVLTAMRNASHRTQFASNVTDMPMPWRSDAGKMVFKLRTFAKQQSTFITGLVNNAIKGDVAPLARYLITYPTVYFVMRPYLDFLSSRPLVDQSDEETLERISNALEGAAWAGMFGGLGDFINQVASSDAGRVMGIPLGVAGATAAGIAADTGALVAKGDARPLAKRAMRTPLALPFHLYENLKTMTEGQ